MPSAAIKFRFVMDAPRPIRCDPDVVMAEVVVVLSEMAEFLVQDDDENRDRANMRASMRAQHEAIVRGQHLSYFFASWLADVRMARHRTPRSKLPWQPRVQRIRVLRSPAIFVSTFLRTATGR